MNTNPQATTTPIVSILNGVPTTTSLTIASGAGIQHKNVLGLVRTYQADLEEFGSLAFETRVMREDGRGGEQTQIAILNERQATLIMTYMRNTVVVREFKKRLVKAFFELAQQQATATPQAVVPAPNPIQGKTICTILDDQANEIAKLANAVAALTAQPTTPLNLNIPLDAARGTDGSVWVTHANTVGDPNWKDPLWNLLLNLEDAGFNVDGCKTALRVRDLLTADACRAAKKWNGAYPQIHISKCDATGRGRIQEMVAIGAMVPKLSPQLPEKEGRVK